MHIITRMVKGGAQENVLDKTVRLDPQRFTCILATGHSDGPEGSLIEVARERGADIREIPWLVREISPVNDIRAVAALVRLIRKERPDIVHTHTSKAGIVGRVAARIARVPVVIHEPHGHVFHGYYGKFKTALFISLERRFARYANRIVMLTTHEQADHVELRIAPTDKFVKIHSGIDFDAMFRDGAGRGALRKTLGIGDDDKVIGTLGRLVEVKGQIHLINAMPAIISQIPNAHLVLIGSGPLHDALESRAAEIGVNANVHFAGYRADVAACLKDVDVFVLPSLNEGMGRVLVEAMAMRLPCVASNVCGILDLIQDGRNGRLVPPANSEAIAAAVTEILRDPDLAQRLGNEAYSFAVPGYGVDAMLQKTETMYCAELVRVSQSGAGTGFRDKEKVH
jgi:glycosyltransferase involved in cell wall biosynthesis